MSIKSSLRSYINFSYRFLRKQFGARPFSLLDIGSGNQSASKITTVFPNCEYHGLDITREYNYRGSDFEIMKAFYELDLTKLDYHIIPDNYFDAIWMVHVIEHLPNGEEVIAGLVKKLKPGGCFYIEYPGQKSTTLPSMYGTLNFYDDPTHVRIYSVKELANVFEKHNCRVVKSGTRRNWYYIAAVPARVLATLLRRKKIQANIFWDVTGFAEFLFVAKK